MNNTQSKEQATKQQMRHEKQVENYCFKEDEPVAAKPGIWMIFLLFFKIGSVGFGGGPALISIIEQEIVEKKRWIPERTFLQGMAISLMPPGSIMVNIAFFVGDYLQGFFGGLAALFGILLPSFFIMVILAGVYVTMQSLNLGNTAIRGLAPAVVGVLIAMVYNMSKKHIKKWWAIFLLVIPTLLMYYYKVPPYMLILVAFILGIALKDVVSCEEPPAVEEMKKEIAEHHLHDLEKGGEA